MSSNDKTITRLRAGQALAEEANRGEIGGFERGSRHGRMYRLRAGQAAFETLRLLDHDRADALRGTDADPFYDDAKLPKFWENLGCAPATIVEEDPRRRRLPGGRTGPSPAPYETMQVAFEAAVGGGYQMPDGRDFWIDGPVAREIATRIVRAGLRFDSPDGGCPCSDEGALAIRSLKRIEAELKEGDIAHDRLEFLQDLAWEIVELVAAHGGPSEARRHPARGDGDDLDDEVHDYVLVHPGCLRRDIVDYIAGRDDAVFNSADVAESVVELIIEGRLKRGKHENTVEVAATGCEDDGR